MHQAAKLKQRAQRLLRERSALLCDIEEMGEVTISRPVVEARPAVIDTCQRSEPRVRAGGYTN